MVQFHASTTPDTIATPTGTVITAIQSTELNANPARIAGHLHKGTVNNGRKG